MNKIKALLLCLFFAHIAHSQNNNFPESWEGLWNGTMFIYSKGVLKDSVETKLTIAKTQDAKIWTWKTEYLSPKMPMVKDYTFRLKDASKNLYVTDEGNGLELSDYLFGNKLYSVFETEGYLLTATYEMLGENLIFEVTSGKKDITTAQNINVFSVDNIQRVVYKRQKK